VNAPELVYIRASSPVDTFFGALTQMLSTAFSDDVRSIYVLGSRADSTAIPSSDVDLAVILRSGIDPETARQVGHFIEAVGQISPVMLDVTVVREDELARGVAPNLKNNRLLRGPDLLRDCPMIPKSQLIYFYAGLAIHFAMVVRGGRGITLPLSHPEPDGLYCGYERHGIRVADGTYVPGFNLFVSLVLALASFRLATRAGVFPSSKSEILGAYQRHLPGDPMLPIVTDAYEICRLRLQGRVPAEGLESRQIALRCRQILPFESEFLEVAMKVLEDGAAGMPAELRAQALSLLNRVQSDSPAQLAKLDQIKRALGGPA
jgi:hypothetical protein